jgi:tetratricopeptide (TPR) repeat protein
VEEVYFMQRRDFLKLALNASVFALVRNAALPVQAKFTTIDLDWAEEYARELQCLFEKGNVQYVLEAATHCYNMIEHAQFPATVSRAAELQMRFGLLLARVQDATLPWYQRAYPAIQTYNRIEEEILHKYPLRAFPFYRAYLLAHRGPLFREIGQLEKSIEQFTRALDTHIHDLDDTALHVELYYSRAHVWAVRGNINNWLQDLEAARTVAQTAQGDQRKQLLGLINYTQGEGYKRLAYNRRLDLSDPQRAQCAARGLTCFEQAHFALEKCWAAHTLIHGVAEAQCLVWLDPNESILQAERLRVQAHRVYPSIVQKIDHTIRVARSRL